MSDIQYIDALIIVMSVNSYLFSVLSPKNYVTLQLNCILS